MLRFDGGRTRVFPITKNRTHSCDPHCGRRQVFVHNRTVLTGPRCGLNRHLWRIAALGSCDNPAHTSRVSLPA